MHFYSLSEINILKNKSFGLYYQFSIFLEILRVLVKVFLYWMKCHWLIVRDSCLNTTMFERNFLPYILPYGIDMVNFRPFKTIYCAADYNPKAPGSLYKIRSTLKIDKLVVPTTFNDNFFSMSLVTLFGLIYLFFTDN